jgi:trehalose 6-phosphate phosphatase
MGETAARTFWFFDFDGTLATIVADRSGARLHPACRDMLRKLVANPGNIVAVLSSRSLNDLLLRVPVSGVFLGGGSGIEWRIPGGDRLEPPPEMAERVEQSRQRVVPVLKEMVTMSGAGFEDKYWSAAVHVRLLSPSSKELLGKALEQWRSKHGIGLYRGPEVFEVQFLPELNKEFGVRTLCRFVAYEPGRDRLCYAGDDENDAMAMAWVAGQGGRVFSMGGHPLVDGAMVLDGPGALATAG